MRIKSRAPGKLILLGEYAVLEGVPALVTAVDRLAEVVLQTTNADHCIIEAPDIGISRLPFTFDGTGKVTFIETVEDETLKKLSFLLTVIEEVQELFGSNLYSVPSFELSLNTSQFFNAEKQKLGLGSSAAVTAALLSVLCQFRNKDFDIEKQRERIFKISLQIHRKAQNNIGSGIDIAATVFGGVLKYKIMDKTYNTLPIHEKLTIPGDLHILFVWTGESASTTQFVRKVNEFKANQSSSFHKIIDRMQHSSTSGIKGIQQKNIDQFMQAVNQYFEAMKELGEQSKKKIVSEAHQKIHDLVAAEEGAYKPSGAGGGDIGIAFCDSAARKSSIAKKLIKSGFNIINLQLAESGVHTTTL